MGTAILGNHLLTSAFLGWASAQVIKTILYLIVNKKVHFERLIGSGGMPSAHSASVTACAVTAGLVYGLASSQFALAALLACIVMYDACGVRRAVGEHAKHLNELHILMTENSSPEEKFKVLIGHTPLQVLIGFIVGVASAAIIHFI